MSNERAFKGIWIPAEIWLRDDLTIEEKVLLAEIDSFSKKETGCIAGNSYFAKFIGKSITNTSNMINKLIKLGLVELVHFNGRSRTLASIPVNFLQDFDVITQSSHTDSVKPPYKNCKADIQNSEDALYNNTNKVIKSVIKDKTDKKAEPLFRPCIDVYQKFITEQKKLPFIFGAVDGKHMKEIIKKLRAVEPDDTAALLLWETIFARWDRLDGFLQDQITPSQINHFFTNILNTLKNGKNGKQSAADWHIEY